MKRFEITTIGELQSQDIEKTKKELYDIAFSAIWSGDKHHQYGSNIFGESSSKLDYRESTVRDQEMIIVRLQHISELLEDHDRRAATSDQVVDQGHAIQDQIVKNRETIQATLQSLHHEMHKSSLRHRLTVYASVSVFFSTALLILTLVQGALVVEPIIPTLITIASVLFWVMARMIPSPPSLPDIL